MRKNKGKIKLALATLVVVFFGVALAGLSFTLPGMLDYLFTGHDYISYDLAANNTTSAAALVEKISLGNVSATPVFIPPATGKVIRVDLSAMKLSLYQDGTVVATIDILARGRPGSPWDTPAGEYSVLTKEENHYSSIGNVNMPWSLQFFGNFFIHGWPTYPDGKAVPAGFSGGCVRLSTPAAKQVYAFADAGTRVSVYGLSTNTSNYVPHYESSKSFFLLNHPQPLTLSTTAYLVADLETGEIITQDQMNKVVPIASLTKLMTALVSLEVLNQEKVVTVSKTAAAMPPTSGGLRAGEKIKTSNLLYPLLLVSGNDAAEQLAEGYGREQFVKTMNTKATAIGLSQTFFTDPTGLDAGDVSSAFDLAKLAHYLYTYKEHIWEITKLPAFTLSGHVWKSFNNFHDNTFDYLGGKIGFTDEAKQTQVAIFSVPFVGGESRSIVVALLQSNDRKGDLQKIVNYLKRYVFYGTAIDLPGNK